MSRTFVLTAVTVLFTIHVILSKPVKPKFGDANGAVNKDHRDTRFGKWKPMFASPARWAIFKKWPKKECPAPAALPVSEQGVLGVAVTGALVPSGVDGGIGGFGNGSSGNPVLMNFQSTSAGVASLRESGDSGSEDDSSADSGSRDSGSRSDDSRDDGSRDDSSGDDDSHSVSAGVASPGDSGDSGSGDDSSADSGSRDSGSRSDDSRDDGSRDDSSGDDDSHSVCAGVASPGDSGDSGSGDDSSADSGSRDSGSRSDDSRDDVSRDDCPGDDDSVSSTAPLAGPGGANLGSTAPGCAGPSVDVSDDDDDSDGYLSNDSGSSDGSDDSDEYLSNDSCLVANNNSVSGSVPSAGPGGVNPSSTAPGGVQICRSTALSYHN